MVSASRLLTTAAREVVQDIAAPYDDYHAELVRTFGKVLQILQEEPNERSQRRAIETLLTSLSRDIGSSRDVL